MDFSTVVNGLLKGVDEWGSVLLDLPENTITAKRNSQNRSIKQILGHMVDSASNNTHRIVHLQYRENPMSFPNYASNGNNDRWIGIQNYQMEDWQNLVQLWKYLHLHLVHVIRNVKSEKTGNVWISGSEHGNVSLNEMITDFLRHFHLHLNEIQELIEQ